MKKVTQNFTLIFLFLFAFNFSNAQCPNFNISAPSGTVVGCNPTVVPLLAVDASGINNVTYTWVSALTGTTVGNPINAGGPTIYTVTASAPGTTCTTTQTIQISQDLSAPSITVTPISRTLTCNSSAATFTGVASPTTNVVGQWIDQGGVPVTSQSSFPLFMQTASPGTYSFVATNLTNGCASTQTVIAVRGSTIVPTMTLNSIQGNTITCNNPCLAFNITSSPGPAPISYSWTNVTTSVTTTPATGGYTICLPGNYIAQYRDGNLCIISQTINISIDTLRPTPMSGSSLGFNTYTLNCYTPTLTATGFSYPLYPASNYSWTIPPNLTIATQTLGVTTVSVTSNPTTYTVSAKGNNGCVGKAKVFVYKDIFTPPYSIVATPSAITCSNPTVALTPSSSSTVPVTFTITSPAPTTTATTAGATFSIAGTYTLFVNNTLNGCISLTTANVPINVTVPSTLVMTPGVIPCGGTTVNVGPSTSTAFTYTWTGPGGSIISSPNSNTTSVNMSGTYSVMIKNAVNGCTNTNFVSVSQATSIPISITGNSVICIGNTGSLTASGATTYTWSTGSNSTSISVSPTVNTTYTVSGTGTAGCPGQSIKTITVVSLPTIGISSIKDTICPSSTLALNASGAISYTWSTGSNFLNINVTPSVTTTYTVSGTSSFGCVSSKTKTVFVMPCAGIKEYTLISGVKIYPNPNNGVFNIRSDVDLNLSIINELGQEVKKINLNSSNNREVSVSELQNGIYFVIGRKDSQVMKQKIIITK